MTAFIFEKERQVILFSLVAGMNNEIGLMMQSTGLLFLYTKFLGWW